MKRTERFSTEKKTRGKNGVQFDTAFVDLHNKYKTTFVDMRTTTTNEEEKEDEDYDLLYGDVGDSDDENNENNSRVRGKTTTTTSAIETGDGDGTIGKKGRTEEEEEEEEEEEGTKGRERQQERREKEDDEEKNTSVYVANLTWWTTDRKVEQLAGEFGVVKRIHFFTEKKNGKSKGCAAVEFTTAKAAELCAENLNKRAIEGKACVVTLAPSTGDAGTTTPRAPLGPPPDTAWKGPIPAGQGAGGMSTTQAQLNALQQQQKMKLLMMQQHMKAKMSGQQKSTTGTPKMPRENLDETKRKNDDGASPTAGQRERPNSPPLAGTRQNGRERGRGRGRGGQRTRAESPPAAQMGGRGGGGGRKRARR